MIRKILVLKQLAITLFFFRTEKFFSERAPQYFSADGYFFADSVADTCVTNYPNFRVAKCNNSSPSIDVKDHTHAASVPILGCYAAVPASEDPRYLLWLCSSCCSCSNFFG